MRGFFLIIFFFIIVLIAVVYGAPSISGRSDPDVELTPSSQIPSSTSLLPLKPRRDTEIVATLDGAIHLMELKSRNVLWSFMSGPSIYSSYQGLPYYQSESNNFTVEEDNFYIDCGEDWKLYKHRNGFKKEELPFNVEEILKHTPYVSANGIMVGSKKTTVFVVDAETGKLIHTFRSDSDTDVGQNLSLAATETLKLLFIMRTDYTLKFTSVKTRKVLWYLMFADFEASQQCNNFESFIGGLPDQEDLMNSGYVFCSKNPVVHRVRDQKSFELIFGSNKPQNAPSGDGLLSLPGSNCVAGKAGMLGMPIGDSDELLESIFGAPSGKWPLVVYNSTNDNVPCEIAQVGSGVVGLYNSTSLQPVHPYNWKFVVLSAFVPVLIAAFSSACTVLWKWCTLHKQVTDPKLLAVISKKKKARKSGLSKTNTRNQKNKKNSHNDDAEVSGEFPQIGKSEKVLKLNISKDDSLGCHRKIGKLLVSSTEIAKGSNGTIVLEGIYDGRPVAVKRLVQTHHEVALKEIQNLIASDQHPNIVRWYGVEYDQDFVYLSLERCTCSLYEFISSFSSSYQKQFSGNDQDACFSDCTVQFQWKSGDKEDFPLWKPNGYPSPHLLKLMRDMVHGLAHLHELGIVHRDLKPQNVLVVKERSICAKLSDMGISKRLAGDMSSLTKNSTGSGSSGWQAPEQLRQERQTRAVDLFSLGCLLFFCITGGKHPFGDSFERDVNIANNQKDLFLIENFPEAADLISALLQSNPELRPKAVEIPHHPFFWDSEMRLSFLRDASDRVELEDRENGSELLEALESVKTVALGGLWNERMDSAFINDIGRYRRYKYDSVRDLLRVIRNKLNHYRELSKEIQGILGQVPEGFDSYFSTRFPRLVVEVYKVFRTYCIEEDIFQKYFKSNQI